MIKTCEDDLAIFGGTPAFDYSLHVNLPNIGERQTFDGYLDEIWDRRWFTNNGPLASKLENVLQDFIGVKHCVLMSSGTSALSVLVSALGLSGEVIMPSFTFVSTAHVLQWGGITPVFCDIDPLSWNIDCVHCEKLITDRTTAIIATHLWGRPCEIDRLQKLTDRHGLRLIFDAAHAFGCTYQGQTIGRFGDAEVFSFQANKVFHSAEGGAITCDDDALADQLRAIRNFGFTGYDRVEYLGMNAKFSELSAAMGLTNFELVGAFIEQNKKNYETYFENLSELRGMEIQTYNEIEKRNYQYISLKLTEQDGVSRDDIVQILHAENILARRYFHPGCHQMEPYRSLFPGVGQTLPITNRIAESVLILPGGAGVSTEDIRGTCALLRFILENAESIGAKLGKRSFELAAK